MPSPLIRDALQCVHEQGTLSKQSGKFKAILSAVAAGSEGPSTSLRPLCPTRWSVQGKTIRAVLSQYESALSGLEEMTANGSDTGMRANGLRERYKNGTSGLLLALEVIEDLECLNKSLQKRTETIAGIRSAIECVRSTQTFRRFLTKQWLTLLGMSSFRFLTNDSRKRSQHTPKSPEEHYRTDFYKMLHCVDVQFKERFNQPDLNVLQKLEETLLSGEVNDIVDQCPELSIENLKVQHVSPCLGPKTLSNLVLKWLISWEEWQLKREACLTKLKPLSGCF